MADASVSAAPRTILRGVKDKSGRTPPAQSPDIPTHLPHVFDFAPWGPETPQFVDGEELLRLFGDSTLDLRGKYATHQTALINEINAQGNKMIFQRIIPGDAEIATKRLYLEIAEDVNIPVYERDDEGDVVLDSNGDPVQKEDSDGEKVWRTGTMARWVASRVGLERSQWSSGQDYPENSLVEHDPDNDTDSSDYEPRIYRAIKYVPEEGANGDPIEPGAWRGYGENWRDYWEVVEDDNGDPVDPQPVFGEAHVIGPDEDETNADPFDTGEPWPESLSDDRVKDDTKVTIYPIMDFEVSHYGERGKLQGFRLWAPTTEDNDPIDEDLVYDQAAYLYRLQIMERPDKKSTGETVTTTSGAPYIDVAFDEKARNEATGIDYDIEERFPEEYRDLDADPSEYGPFNRFYLYRDNVKEISKKLYQAEIVKRNQYTFPTWDSEEKYYGGHIVRYDPDETDGPGEGYYRLEADEATEGEDPESSDDWTRIGDTSTDFDEVFDNELDVEPDWRWDDDEGKYIFNFVSGKDIHGNPYLTFELVGADSGGVELTSSSTIYADGGDDGTVDLDTFDEEVAKICEDYGEGEWNFLDTAYWPQSVIYDSGFSLETKEKLITPVGRRKDIAVIVSTQDVREPQNSVEAENSIAGILRARARSFPESSYHGTHVHRVAIIGHSGYLINSEYKDLLPLTVEFARKAARFMGASSGTWARNRGFDQAPLNQIESFKDVNHPWKSQRQYHSDWEVGLNWVQNFDRRSLFFPAYQTVYDDDTSVLNSLVNMFITVEAEKVAERVWRRLTGDAKLTREQFLQKSDDLILRHMQGRFDDRVVVEPKTYFTDYDETLGYSWSTDITLYMNNMRTVNTITIISERRSQLD